MAESIATAILFALAAYLSLGLLATIFILSKLERFDDQAHGSSLTFRLLLVPGMLVFWPAFLRRWKSGYLQPREESNPHREAARVMRGER